MHAADMQSLDVYHASYCSSMLTSSNWASLGEPVQTLSELVITHTSTAGYAVGNKVQVLQHGADRTQHTAFAYIATLSGIYGDATACLRMYSNIHQSDSLLEQVQGIGG